MHAAPLWRANALLKSNTDMEEMHNIERRLTELEIKLSFTEDLVEDLNQIIVRQQQQLDAVMRELLQLRQQGPDDGTAPFRSLRDELPPHY